MNHCKYSFNADTWMLGILFSSIADPERKSCFEFQKYIKPYVAPDYLDQDYDPKFTFLTKTKPYKSPPYEELITKETRPTPPDPMYGSNFKELIYWMMDYEPETRP